MNCLHQKIKRSPVSLLSQEQNYIDNFVLSNEFPWYWQDSQTTGIIFENDKNETDLFYNGPYLSHILLTRASAADQSHVDRLPDNYSFPYKIFYDIFHRFMYDNNITYTKIYRMNLNLTWYNSDLLTQPHIDHNFEHRNFIMYLTNCDKGNTVIWSNDQTEEYRSPCEKNMSIQFDGLWHAHEYPVPGQKRVIFVVTYI